jgi:hypothetical protein
VCLAKATQPPSVWIPAITACSCVVILPALNKLLRLRHLSALPRLIHSVSLISASAGIPNVFDV